MKNIILILITSVAFLSCKKTEDNSVFYVQVNGQNYYNNNSPNEFNIDIDRDNSNDISVKKTTLTNSYYDEWGYYITTTYNSIELSESNDGAEIEFSAIDDCVILYYGEEEINQDLKFEESVTLANDFDVSCNENQTNRRYIGFRIKKNGDWHNGWMELTYNLNVNYNNNYNNLELTMQGWAYHRQKDASIWTGQKD